jgi:class 3 adenylate cyclase
LVELQLRAAAVGFQQENTDFIAVVEEEIEPRIRIGIATGEVVVADDAVTGEGIVAAQ